MQNAAKTLGAGSRALSGLLGLAVIGLALAVLTTPMDVGGVIDWAERIFGAVFILLFAGMVYIALLSILQVKAIALYAPGHRSWFETGLQSGEVANVMEQARENGRVVLASLGGGAGGLHRMLRD